MLMTLTVIDKQAQRGMAAAMKARGTQEFFLLFSLGGQPDHLLRECLEKLEILSFFADASKITAKDIEYLEPTGIILSGLDYIGKKVPLLDEKIFSTGVPILGVNPHFQMFWTQYHANVEAFVASCPLRFGRQLGYIFDDHRYNSESFKTAFKHFCFNVCGAESRPAVVAGA